MSKRTLRRAAERKARKLERTTTVSAIETEIPPTTITAAAAVTTTAVDQHEHDDQPPSTATTANELQLPSNAEPHSNAKPESLMDKVLANLRNPPPTESKSASPAQIAQLSTGPTSPAGRAIVSQNRRFHGLSGNFALLAHEDAAEFQLLAQSIYTEHQPASDTEERFANSVIQHYWLMQRAIHFQQQILLQASDPSQVDEKRLGLFLRYQSTHERSYYKALRELQNVQKQTRKEQIGFESQIADREAQEARTRLTNARASMLEIDTAARQIMEAPLPGTTRIPFEELTKACGSAIAAVAYKYQFKAAS